MPITSPSGNDSKSASPSVSSCPCSFSICSASSRVPFMPAPLTLWYELMTSDRRPAARCSGPTASIAAIVVQFGTATIRGEPASASGLTSGIDSGTAGSIRKALELSTHVVPAAAACGMKLLDTDAPALTRARSTPRRASSESTSTV